MVPSKEKRFSRPDLVAGLEASADRSHSCEMCGLSTTSADLMLHEEILWMCSRCSDYLDSLPRALRETMSRYLIGNVL